MGTDTQAGRRARVKQRFLKEGLDNFQPHEVLEMLLFNTLPRGDTKQIAYGLLKRFGTITAVLQAPVEELIKVDGVGESVATMLSMIPQLFRYYQKEGNKLGTIIEDAEDAATFLFPYFIGRSNEVVYVLCLDSKKAVLACEMIEEGTVNSSPVNVRKIVELVVRVGATAVVIAHNHPQGIALPSFKDVETTKVLKESLRNLDVALVDHIIVDGGNDYVSLAQSGKM